MRKVGRVVLMFVTGFSGTERLAGAGAAIDEATGAVVAEVIVARVICEVAVVVLAVAEAVVGEVTAGVEKQWYARRKRSVVDVAAPVGGCRCRRASRRFRWRW